MGHSIIVNVAWEHNLKNADAEIACNKLVVITGLSGGPHLSSVAP